VKKNIRLLYGFAFFDQFMIVIPLLVPYLATKGITMGQFMELQAVFAVVIVCGELPAGMLSDRWGRRRTLLLGSALKAMGFTLLPLWVSYEGFLFYHLTMGIALSMISGGDVALLYDSHLAAGGKKAEGTAILGNARLAGQVGVAVSALLGGAIATFSYDYLLWANAVLGWVSVLLVLRLVEPPPAPDREKKQHDALPRIFSNIWVRDAATRLVLLNLIASGVLGLVMVWTNQKYWQVSEVPLIYFGILWASYNLISGIAGRLSAVAAARYGWRPVLAAAGLLPSVALFGMAYFLGWAGIVLGMLVPWGRGLADVLLLDALNQRIPSANRATIISMTSLCVRGIFAVLGPAVGYAIDGWGLALVLSVFSCLSFAIYVFLLLPLVLREIMVSQPSRLE
jgi:predicted MFS family arabinose efflux permease